MGTVKLDESIELAQRRALARVRPTVRRPAHGAEVDGYAGLVTRVLAFALDALIVNGIALVAALAVSLGLSVLHLPSDIDAVIAAVGGGVWIVWSVAYFVFFWSSTGQTPGDRTMRIRVIDARGGETLKPRRAVLRFVGLLLAAIPLLAGLWMMLWDERRRCLQDRIAGTLVLYEPDEQPVRPGLVLGPQAAAGPARQA
jgi:uncharacterized RDD family membrane protein YckC